MRSFGEQRFAGRHVQALLNFHRFSTAVAAVTAAVVAVAAASGSADADAAGAFFRMGDFGPAYASRNAPQSSQR